MTAETAVAYLAFLLIPFTIFILGMLITVPAAIKVADAEEEERPPRWRDECLRGAGAAVVVFGTPLSLIVSAVTAYMVVGGPAWAPWTFFAVGVVVFGLALWVID